MKYVFKIIILVAIIVTAVSCGRVKPLREDAVVARVGEKKLMLSEAEQIFVPGMNPQDSIKVLESFVDLWVKKQLKVREAENRFKESSDDIEKKVEEYRNSLLTLKLDQYYIAARLDSLYDNHNAVQNYYNNNMGEFLLDRPIVKGRVVKLPDNYRQKKQLADLMSGSGEKYQDFINISDKNDFTLTEYDKWVDFSHFMSTIPASVKRDNDKIFNEKGVSELKDGKDIYLIYITEKLAAKDRSPLERVEETIKQVLYNQRKQEILRAVEDSIYQAAVKDNSLEINLN